MSCSLMFSGMSARSAPHCIQLHYIPHEIERVLPDHVPMEHFVCTEEGAIPVTAEAVELSKSLAKLTKLAKEAEA